ncbi:MAG: HD domain-containing protein [Clostridiales bacterium]|nr:HD domain-containing protein [Clostridiales bacterium]
MSMVRGKQRGSYTGGLILCILGVAVNVALKELVIYLGLPLYLDTIGTVLAAVLGGYLPGVIVGLLTNGLAAIGDYSSMYYAVLNVMIAVVAAWFSDRAYIKKVWGIILFIISLALIGGGLGTILPWCLDGVPLETEALSAKLYDMGLTNVPLAQLTANILVDLLDKTVTVAIALITLRFLPEKLCSKLKFQGWMQRPLSKEETKEARRKDIRIMSLKTKIMIILVVSFTVVAVVAGSISSVLFREDSIRDHTELAEGAAEIAASLIDPAKVDEYMDKGRSSEEYLRIEKQLYTLMASSEDIEYIYIYRIKEDGSHVVFDLDTEETPAAAPGDVVPFDEGIRERLPDLLAGKETSPVETVGSFGWLLSAYHPVYDASGNCVCYTAADVSMKRITANIVSFIVGLMSLFLAFFIVILVVVLWLVEYHVVLPLNSMALRAGAFAYDSEEARRESIDKLRDLEIGTGDEIEHLYGSFLKTSEDSLEYVDEIQNKTETISRMQNALIFVLADMVESRDQTTGDHVRKTAAYSGIILRSLRERGYYPDIITDDYISDVINSSPLHDVGKIRIPDSILNKPGRLTDEEYEIMKKHTTYGKDIIDQAMEAVPDSSYLSEARNLAQYHHEKWNGKGYPQGLAGDKIPLSARVMAVADVFDALVSKRSYKEPLPMDQAIGLIVEGSGDHFDPKCVEAFLAAEEEVRKVYERFAGMTDDGIFH